MAEVAEFRICVVEFVSEMVTFGFCRIQPDL
jgi:hypothetical protein